MRIKKDVIENISAIEINLHIYNFIIKELIMISRVILIIKILIFYSIHNFNLIIFRFNIRKFER